MFRSLLGHLSQKPISSTLQQQSTKIKPIAQRSLFVDQHPQQLQQLRLLSGTSCLQNEYKYEQFEFPRNRRKSESSNSFTNKRNSTYRRRRFVDLEGADNRPNRHLYTLPSDVYGTSDRVTKLLKFQGIDEAYELLTHLPLDLQSTVTWNQILNACGQEGRAALAETMFIQMRKRGIDPSERTFAHILTAFIISNSPTKCERAERWIEKMKTYGIQPTAFHYNTLLNVYGSDNQHNHVVAKVRQMMRDDGLLPYPDKVSISIALQTVPLLLSNHNKEIKRIWNYMVDCLKRDFGYQDYQPVESPKKMTALQAKVYQLQSSDITFRNDRQSIRDQENSQAAMKYGREPLDVDDTLVVSLIRALGRSNPKQPAVRGDRQADNNSREHLQLVIDIMDQLYGLRPSIPSLPESAVNETNDFKCFGLVPGVTVLDTIVRYCGAVQQYELGEAYFDMMVQRFPTLEPDSRAYDAYAWMQSNTRRKNFKRNKKNGTSDE